MNLEMRRCGNADLDVLIPMARDTFEATFRPLIRDESMDAYVAQAFTIERMRSELTNPGSEFYFAVADDARAGYLKLNAAPAQSDLNDLDSLEIERIYVVAGFQGHGIGRAMVEFAADRARALDKRYLWLGVWEHNEDAIQFYRHVGFEAVGSHEFRMGDEVQRDLIMKRKVGRRIPPSGD